MQNSCSLMRLILSDFLYPAGNPVKPTLRLKKGKWMNSLLKVTKILVRKFII